MINSFESNSKLSALAFDQDKAQSFTLGNPRLHTELESHETNFDAAHQEHLYQEAVKLLEATGEAERIVIEEPGCDPLVIYRIGEPKFIINSHIHGDEPGPAIPVFIELVDRILLGDPRIKNVLIIPRCNEEAYKQLQRGVPLDNDLLQRLMDSNTFNEDDEQKILQSGDSYQEVFFNILQSKGYYVSEDDEDAYYIDLNRQFIETDDFKEPKVLALFPKARQLLRAVRTYASNAQEGFSFHSDNSLTTVQIDPNTKEETEVQSGCYVYDTPEFYTDSPKVDVNTEEFIKHCVSDFQTQMKENGIPLLTGVDDITDELLGMNEFVEGYGCVPAKEIRLKDKGIVVVRTKELQDQTFETAMVRWGMKRYWCAETSGWINIPMRKKMIQILLDTLVLPIMERNNSMSA